jgi:hypothetical protein
LTSRNSHIRRGHAKTKQHIVPRPQHYLSGAPRFSQMK